MLSDQVHGSFGANSLDGATVVTTQQNTQIDELKNREKVRTSDGLYEAFTCQIIEKTEEKKPNLLFGQVHVLQDAIKVELLDGKLSKTNEFVFFISILGE